jgi:hypothetical protein
MWKEKKVGIGFQHRPFSSKKRDKRDEVLFWHDISASLL